MKACARRTVLLIASATSSLAACDGSPEAAITSACAIRDAGEAPAPPRQPDASGVACTRIGCLEGITIAIRDARGDAVMPTRWALEFDGARVSGASCDPVAFDGGEIECAHGRLTVNLPIGARHLPSLVSVSVETVTGLRADACVAAQYSLFQPNGIACAPICRSARIDLIVR